MKLHSSFRKVSWRCKIDYPFYSRSNIIICVLRNAWPLIFVLGVLVRHLELVINTLLLVLKVAGICRPCSHVEAFITTTRPVTWMIKLGLSRSSTTTTTSLGLLALCSLTGWIGNLTYVRTWLVKSMRVWFRSTCFLRQLTTCNPTLS